MEELLTTIEISLWSYLGIPFIILMGIYFTYRSKVLQIRSVIDLFRNKKKYLQTQTQKETENEVHPFKAFLTSLGGAIGIGNIVVVCFAVKVGGPGAVFWLWIAAFVGMLLKYSENYLGLKFREKQTSENTSFLGGPFYYLQRLPLGKILSILFALLMCFYGIEILMFNIIVENVHDTFALNKHLSILLLLLVIIIPVIGGLKRISDITSILVPLFVIIYMAMTLWILIDNWHELPRALSLIFSSAFKGTAPIGAFAGSSLFLTMSQGVQRACYTGDICIGYSSTIYSEAKTSNIKSVARFSLLEIFIDTFIISTSTLLIILVTDIWHTSTDISLMIKEVLNNYFPYANFFFTLLVFLTGYSTIIAFLHVGVKMAESLNKQNPRKGKALYLLTSILLFCFFSYTKTEIAASFMGLTGALLMTINVYGIFMLRKEIDF